MILMIKAKIFLNKNLFYITDLAAVCDLNAEAAGRQAQAFGTEKVMTIDEVAADPEIKPVVNLTGPAAHYSVIKQMLLAREECLYGKDVHNQAGRGAGARRKSGGCIQNPKESKRVCRTLWDSGIRTRKLTGRYRTDVKSPAGMPAGLFISRNAISDIIGGRIKQESKNMKIGSFYFDTDLDTPYSTDDMVNLIFQNKENVLFASILMTNADEKWSSIQLPCRAVERDGMIWLEYRADPSSIQDPALAKEEGAFKRVVEGTPLCAASPSMKKLTYAKNEEKMRTYMILENGKAFINVYLPEKDEDPHTGAVKMLFTKFLEYENARTFRDIKRLALTAKKRYQESVHSEEDPFTWGRADM